MSFEYFSETFGLVTKDDPTTENGGLFFAHYLVLKKLLKMQITTNDYVLYRFKMDHAFVDYGLYLRSSYHTTRTVSQDEITGMTVASYILGTTHRFSIWSKLFRGFGNYPATGRLNFFNPGSYYIWAELANSKIAWILFPWYFLNLVISSSKPKSNTSSKLLYFTELNSCTHKSKLVDFMLGYFSLKMVKMYGLYWEKELFAIYFISDEEHPLRKLSEKL